MTKNDALVAVFIDHRQAESAIRKLADDGLDVKHFSIVGKGYHKEGICSPPGPVSKPS